MLSNRKDEMGRLSSEVKEKETALVKELSGTIREKRLFTKNIQKITDKVDYCFQGIHLALDRQQQVP